MAFGTAVIINPQPCAPCLAQIAWRHFKCLNCKRLIIKRVIRYAAAQQAGSIANETARRSLILALVTLNAANNHETFANSFNAFRQNYAFTSNAAGNDQRENLIFALRSG